MYIQCCRVSATQQSAPCDQPLTLAIAVAGTLLLRVSFPRTRSLSSFLLIPWPADTLSPPAWVIDRFLHAPAAISPWASADSERALLEVSLMGQDLELDTGTAPLDVDAEFGGREARLLLEQRLLRKLDVRMFILVLVYTFNYVGPFQHSFVGRLTTLIFVHRSTEIMLRECE